MKELLDRYADVNAWNNSVKTALNIASVNGQQDAAKMCLKYGADVNIVYNNNQTALHLQPPDVAMSL